MNVRDLIKAVEALQQQIEGCRDDEQAEWDERSERWQEGDRGQAVQEQIDHLDAAAALLGDAAAELEEI